MRIRPITLKEVEYTAFELARELLTYNEPIPEFGTRFPMVLESCIAVPFQTYLQEPFYKGLVAKTSILFYLMIKNHPFKNGNKRIAIMTMLVFLHRHGKWLKVSNLNLYKFAVGIAESNSKEKDKYIRHIERFIAANISSAKH